MEFVTYDPTWGFSIVVTVALAAILFVSRRALREMLDRLWRWIS